MPNRNTVFVCEAEPVCIAGLQSFLAETEFEFSGSAQSAAVAAPMIAELRPDLVLIEHAAGVRATVPLISQIRYVSPGIAGLLWTRDVPEAELIRVFQAGARGFVRKSSAREILVEALRCVVQGKLFLEDSVSGAFRQWTTRRSLPRLTPREREVIELVGQGLKNREIALRLSITPGTVKVHLMHVFEKTGARDRYELAIHGSRMLSGGESEAEVRQTA